MDLDFMQKTPELLRLRAAQRLVGKMGGREDPEAQAAYRELEEAAEANQYRANRQVAESAGGKAAK